MDLQQLEVQVINLQQELIEKNIDLMQALKEARAGKAFAKAVGQARVHYKTPDQGYEEIHAALADYEKAIK